MPGRGLAYSLPIPSAVVHPQPTTRALHLCQIGLRAVMGLNPKTGSTGITIHRCHQLWSGREPEILQGACEFTPVMARHLRKGELHQQCFGFTALMQGDFALQQLPAEVGLQWR